MKRRFLVVFRLVNDGYGMLHRKSDGGVQSRVVRVMYMYVSTIRYSTKVCSMKVVNDIS